MKRVCAILISYSEEEVFFILKLDSCFSPTIDKTSSEDIIVKITNQGILHGLVVPEQILDWCKNYQILK